MNYTCPNPECNAEWIWEEKNYCGGTVFSCDSCKKKSTIPLYCPKCNPPSVANKKYLQTPTGFLGGETFRCPSNHTFTVRVTMGEIQDRMGTWGTELGQYRQSERIETMPDQELKQTVSGGYCAGVVYDWVRRLLLRGKTNFADHKTKSRQDVRAAYAWTQQTSAKKNAFIEQKSDALGAAYDRVRNSAIAGASQEETELDTKVDEAFAKIGAASGISEERREELYRKAQEAYDKGIRDIRASRDLKIQQAASKVEGWRSTSIMDKYWVEFSRTMDAYLAQDRASRGKTGASAAQFSDLKISRSVDTSLYTGLDVFIDTLLRDGEFKTNRAAYVGVSPPAEGATGHAIGIFRLGTGKYHLFDPNIGTYELDAAGVREAFVYIFRKAYPNMGSGDTSDNHAYEVGGKIRGGYTIFESALKSVPSVTPLPKPTATLPKPQVLSVMTTPPKFQPVPSSKPAPPLAAKQVGKAAAAGGGGKVSDLINRFNRPNT